jgi:hypothetical protein
LEKVAAVGKVERAAKEKGNMVEKGLSCSSKESRPIQHQTFLGQGKLERECLIKRERERERVSERAVIERERDRVSDETMLGSEDANA